MQSVNVIKNKMAKDSRQKLHDLWYEMKKEGNCMEYVSEMCTQLHLLGTETNTLTKEMVKKKVQNLLNKLG